MRVVEGFKQAAAAGTVARNAIKASLPTIFRRGLYVVGGILAIMWVLVKLRHGLSSLSTSSVPAIPTVPTAKGVGYIAFFFVTSLSIATVLLSQRIAWLRLPLVVLVMVAIGYFWQDLKGPVASWLATSDGGQAIGLSESTLKTWMWVGSLTLIALVWYFSGNRSNSGVPDRALFAKTVITVLILAVAYLLYSVGANIQGVKHWFGVSTATTVEAVCGKYETVAEIGHGNNKVGAINMMERNPAKDLKKSRLVCVTATDKSFMLCAGNSAYNLRHEVVDAPSGYGTDDFLKVGGSGSANCRFYEPKPNSFMLAGLKSVVVRFWLDVP